MLKKALYLFGIVAGAMGVIIAVVIAVKAPPMEEHLGGILYVWNGAERREAQLLAWKVAGVGLGTCLLFLGLGGVLERLDRIEARLRQG